MKLLIVTSLLVAVACGYQQPVTYTTTSYAASTGSSYGTVKLAPVAIVRSVNEAKDDGSFNFGFESENGIKMEAVGSQKQVGAKPEERGTVQRGSYSYTAPDGTPITVTWVADENGFQATGSHLPVAPPMPDHVVKMLDDLRASGALDRQTYTPSRASY